MTRLDQKFLKIVLSSTVMMFSTLCIAESNAAMLLIDPGTIVLQPPDSITEGQLREDIDTLVYALVFGYGGRADAPNFASALQRLTTIQNIRTPEELMLRIDRTLLGIPDNHLSASHRNFSSPERQALLRPGTVGENAISDSNQVWQVERRRHGKHVYLFIAITRFPSAEDPVWADFLPAVERLKGSTDFLVLDMRGNGGGDDTNGIELAKRLNGGPIRYPVEYTKVSQTPASIAILANIYRYWKAVLLAQSQPVPDYLEDLISEQDRRLTEAEAGRLDPEFLIEYEDENQGDPDLRYPNPIYVLIDGACASSCESTADAFEFITNATTIGENTAGYIHYGNVGPIILPHSKVKVNLPTTFSVYFDDRYIERIGITPKVSVPTDRDALDYVLQLNYVKEVTIDLNAVKRR